VPFWYELVMRYTPQRVLELACGSGCIGIELLHSPGDFQLEGLDISPEMLDAYRRKLVWEPEAVQQRVTLHEANMSNYQLAYKGQMVSLSRGALLSGQNMVVHAEGAHYGNVSIGKTLESMVERKTEPIGQDGTAKERERPEPERLVSDLY